MLPWCSKAQTSFSSSVKPAMAKRTKKVGHHLLLACSDCARVSLDAILRFQAERSFANSGVKPRSSTSIFTQSHLHHGWLACHFTAGALSAPSSAGLGTVMAALATERLALLVNTVPDMVLLSERRQKMEDGHHSEYTCNSCGTCTMKRSSAGRWQGNVWRRNEKMYYVRNPTWLINLVHSLQLQLFLHSLICLSNDARI